jgi:hypothetical protein
VRPGISPGRRRGLIRLAILLGSGAALVLLGLSQLGGSGGSDESGLSGRVAAGGPPPATLHAAIAGRLPQAIHGEAATATPSGILLVGGEDAAAASSARVYRFDPASGRSSLFGSLVQPLHDAAAAPAGGRTLVFGGGSTSTFDTVQALQPGGRATVVGHLPAPLSDLSAVPLAGAAYVLGGYDGVRPSPEVLQTTAGSSFVRVARLPTPVRYTAVATLGDKIYAFGGELADGSDTNEIQEYDLATERAVIAGRLPAPTAHAAAITLDGAVYVLGGRVSGSASSRILRFDPATNAGLPAGRLPQPVYDGAAAVHHGEGYLFGGLGGQGTPLDAVFRLH